MALAQLVFSQFRDMVERLPPNLMQLSEWDMSESDRRFQRYVLTPDAFASQRVKGSGFSWLLRGWKDCRVKDMSAAGVLLLSKQDFSLGEGVEVELTAKDGQRMVFQGEVVNLGKEHNAGQNKIGIKLGATSSGSAEERFLERLAKNFRPSM